MEHTLLNGMLASISRTPEKHLCPTISKTIAEMTDFPPQQVAESLNAILNDNTLSQYGAMVIDAAMKMALADADDLKQS
jgi:hypothetical protein